MLLLLYYLFLLLFLFKNYEISKIIYEKGCVQAGEEWMEHNLIIISTIAILTIFFQVCYVGFTILSIVCFIIKLKAQIENIIEIRNWRSDFIVDHFFVSLNLDISLYRSWVYVLRRIYEPTSMRRSPSGTDNYHCQLQLPFRSPSPVNWCKTDDRSVTGTSPIHYPYHSNHPSSIALRRR